MRATEDKKHYVVQFLYCDNNQLFESDVLATESECMAIETMLEDFSRKGLIVEVTAGSGFTSEFVQPRPLDYAEWLNDFKTNDYLFDEWKGEGE